MSQPVIKIENIGKQYRLGKVGTGSLAHDLQRWWTLARGKEDPYLKIGEVNNRAVKGESDLVWALQDINIDVFQGDVLGVVGKNGAGKSTLLKLLSRVTQPSTGSIRVKGRIASLLEVGTGFHPELSGRENIFLNGAILGMTKMEIQSKFDEIVAFSGVERYIDTPVKRYSSGMYVRLAFAVAAHLEPEILIVDEVLAVGDAEFQKKCLGKMKDVSGQGRTVLFVSHNLLAVKSLCNRGVFLEYGRLKEIGPIDQVVNSYSMGSSLKSFKRFDHVGDGICVDSISINDNGIDGNFSIEKDLVVKVCVVSMKEYGSINTNLFFHASDGSLIFATCSQRESLDIGKYFFECVIPANSLNDIIYMVEIMIVENGHKSIAHIKDALAIEGVESKREGSWLGKFPGLVRPKNYPWTLKKIYE